MHASGRVSSGGSSGRRAGVLLQVKYTNQAGALRSVPRESTTSVSGEALPSLDRIKREKGVWWMPGQQEAMKDVIPCDKPWGAGNRL